MIENDLLQLVLADELKDMRKGRGVPGVDMKSGLLLTDVLATREKLTALINGALIQMGSVSTENEAQSGALANALAVGSKAIWPGLRNPPASDLTTRRRDYVQAIGVSERTLTRHEDRAITSLSVYLAGDLSKDPHAKKVEAYLSGHPELREQLEAWPWEKKTRGAADRRAMPTHTQDYDVPSLPIDVPGLLRVQAQAISRARDASLQSLPVQLEIIEQTNRKLGEMWGVELD